jgi:hypothetical protein
MAAADIFAQTSSFTEGLGGLNTSSRRMFPNVQSPLSTSILSNSTNSSRGSCQSYDSRSSTSTVSSTRSNVRTPIGSLSPRSTASVRKHHRDMHLGTRTGFAGSGPVGWAMSNNMDKLIKQEPMNNRKANNQQNKPNYPLQSQFGLRAEKNPQTMKRMRARRGNKNQHRIFTNKKRSPRRNTNATTTGTATTTTTTTNDNNRNTNLLPSPPPAERNQPMPPPRPPQKTPPTMSPRERRKRDARIQRREAGPITGSRAQYEFPESTRRGIYNPPPPNECPWNNTSPRVNDLLTNYDQPTNEERLNERFNSKTVKMPNGTQFKPSLGGLQRGTEKNFGGRGKSVRWSQSSDAPNWMRDQNTDKDALLSSAKKQNHCWKTGYHREGMTGTVGDNTISGEGPTWLVDTMERYNKDLVLHRIDPTLANYDGGSSTIKYPKKKDDGVIIQDGTISGDMPEFITTAATRIDSELVRKPPKDSWYNKKVSHNSNRRHPSHQCNMDTWTYSLGGVRSKVDYGNGIQITDSSVSGDAPTWMEGLSLRTDPGNVNGTVIRRSNNDLDFQNKTFKPEIEKIEQCWTDSTVSGDAPSFMTEMNARVDPRIVREHPKHKRPWKQRNAPTSRRNFPHGKHKPKIRDPKGRTRTKKTKKLPNKVNLHKPKTYRAPEGPVQMRNVSHGSGNGTSTGRYQFA